MYVHTCIYIYICIYIHAYIRILVYTLYVSSVETLNPQSTRAALWVLVEEDGAWAMTGVALYIVSFQLIVAFILINIVRPFLMHHKPPCAVH